MGERAVRVLLLSVALQALAAGARADGPKVYRWVGQDGHVYTSNAPPRDGSGSSDVPAAPAEGEPCGPFEAYVAGWRDAQQSVESWEATIGRLESRTDDFVRRDVATYHASLDRANEHLERARERARRIEAEARAAGMPERCLTE